MNLLELYQNTFGYKAFPFAPGDVTVFVPEASAFNLEAPEVFSARNSFLGTPFFMPVALGDVQLPNEPIVEVQGSKTIIKTPVDNDLGTFKELYSMNDYIITIKGIAVDENNPDEYPEEQVRSIRDLCEAKTNLIVTNRLCGMFNIYYLVIESFAFPAIEGSRDMQPYILNCISDKIFELQLKNEV